MTAQSVHTAHNPGGPYVEVWDTGSSYVVVHRNSDNVYVSTTEHETWPDAYIAAHTIIGNKHPHLTVVR